MADNHGPQFMMPKKLVSLPVLNSPTRMPIALPRRVNGRPHLDYRQDDISAFPPTIS